jgi:uncharacterized membrane protein (DUF373 family)
MLSKEESKEYEDETPDDKVHGYPDEPIMFVLKSVIHWSVRALAVLMTLVIVWGVLDVLFVLIQKLREPPFMLLQISDILATFGAFMAVLIAIEIFVNITIYLREDIIHVKIVMATALMAIARKVIILDVKDQETTPLIIFSIAALVLAMSIGYYLVVVRDKEKPDFDRPDLKE